MSTSQPNIQDFRRSVAEALHRHWILYLIEGIVLHRALETEPHDPSVDIAGVDRILADTHRPERRR